MKDSEDPYFFSYKNERFKRSLPHPFCIYQNRAREVCLEIENDSSRDSLLHFLEINHFQTLCPLRSLHSFPEKDSFMN